MKEKNQLTIQIGKLWNSAEGTNEKYDLHTKVTFDPKEIDVAGPLEGKLLLIKLKDEIVALLENASISLHSSCELCLKAFEQIIDIPTAERQFLGYPSIEASFEDMFLIDLATMTIDLSEMVRQEIILHFPLVSVCSESCKGLCQRCGIDKNVKSCTCSDESLDFHKPFRNLKSLVASRRSTSKKLIKS